MIRTAAAIASVLILSSTIRADEKSVPVVKLPKPVVEAVKKRFPKAELREGANETEDGKTFYEVSFKEEGKNVDVTVTPEGMITVIEKEIDAKDLPKPVTDSLAAKYPGSAYKKAEIVFKVSEGKESIDYYEALLTKDKTAVEVEIAADGTIKKTEDKTGKKD